MRAPVYLLLFLTIFGFAYAMGDEEAPINGRLIARPQFDLKSAIQEFSRIPDWTKLHRDNLPFEAKKITHVLNQYKHITPEEAEKLVSGLLQIGDEFDMENNGKVYLFNRVYCDVPSYVERDQWRFFGGWSGVPVTETEVNALYPFTVKDDGTLELTGVFGGYFGSEYLGLEEFKYFLKRFGQRERP